MSGKQTPPAYSTRTEQRELCEHARPVSANSATLRGGERRFGTVNPAVFLQTQAVCRPKLCQKVALLIGSMLAQVGAEAAPFAYIANRTDGTVSIIDLASDTVLGNPIAVGNGPVGVALNPKRSRVYVTNSDDGTVSVIETSNNTVVGDPIVVGTSPLGMAVNPSGSRVYVANSGSQSVSVINATTNSVVGSPIAVPGMVRGIAVSLSGAQVYAASSDAVYVIDAASNTATVFTNQLGAGVWGIAVDSTQVYFADSTTGHAYAYPIAGGGATTLLSGDLGVAGIAIDDLFVYAAVSSSGFIIKVSKFGGTPAPLASLAPSQPAGLALNGDYVYVPDPQGNSVSKISKAGGLPTSIIVGQGPASFGNFIGDNVDFIFSDGFDGP